jgi:hypothetical protein
MVMSEKRTVFPFEQSMVTSASFDVALPRITVKNFPPPFSDTPPGKESSLLPQSHVPVGMVTRLGTPEAIACCAAALTCAKEQDEAGKTGSAANVVTGKINATSSR